ncbi:uncharacterized protein LOC129230167 [Uloborus diversus]|uniref:uncharacterized protein LOC129230167 n=1 Tax=Uloborus diversus TaxID=327109 RepID=UPI002409A8F9|nr:uncharacterized protein LOC129230167 [Uloborus diversus]
MSLLCVQVRSAALIGPPTQFNTYVTLKLQNVKSTTVSVKGNNPSWEQDFIFETNRLDIGLIIEVWNKGMLWDKLLGTQWMPLTRIKYTNETGEGQWLSLDQELVMEEGEVVGTKVPTGHSLLLEAHFELPCDDLEEAELMKKLDFLNEVLGQEISSLREQDRRHNFTHNCSGVSEDSDYTSDVSYPTVQHPSASIHHPNSSASQFGGAAEITRRASEYSSQEDKTKYIEPGNSYEEYYDSTVNYRERNNYIDRNCSEDPLYYNSRPNNRMNSRSTERSRSTRSTSGYNNSLSLDYDSDMRYSFETDRSSKHCHWSEETIDSETDKKNLERFQRSDRRRSLERQTGFDESLHDRFIEQYNQSDHEYRDSTEYPQSSFDSYGSFREDSVSTEWERGSRYQQSQSYTETDSYYTPEWNNETEPTPAKVSNKYVPEERTDWSKVNGTIGVRNNKPKPDLEDWRNDSTSSEWKNRSVESEWSKDSPKTEWNHDIPIIKETPPHGRSSWESDVPPIVDRVPPIVDKVTEKVKGSDRWNGHPVDVTKDKDRWNSTSLEPVKSTESWNNKKLEPVKSSDRRNSVVPAKTSELWNGHVAEPVKATDRWNSPVDTPKVNNDRWAKHSSVEPVNNAEHWKNSVEPAKSGWNEETIEEEEEWAEPMSNHQIDSIISDWQNDNENSEWMPDDEESFEKELPKTDYSEDLDKELPMVEIETVDDRTFKQPRDSIDYEGNTLAVISKDERRASVLSNKGLAPSLDIPELSSDLLMPRTEVPAIAIDDSDPTMSRAKRRWINAFNKIVAQLNEVGGGFACLRVTKRNKFLVPLTLEEPKHCFVEWLQLVTLMAWLRKLHFASHQVLPLALKLLLDNLINQCRKVKQSVEINLMGLVFHKILVQHLTLLLVTHLVPSNSNLQSLNKLNRHSNSPSNNNNHRLNSSSNKHRNNHSNSLSSNLYPSNKHNSSRFSNKPDPSSFPLANNNRAYSSSLKPATPSSEDEATVQPRTTLSYLIRKTRASVLLLVTMHIPDLYLVLTFIDFVSGQETFEELRRTKKSKSLIENPQFGNNQNSKMKHEEEKIVETYHHIIKKILPPFQPNTKAAFENGDLRKSFHDQSLHSPISPKNDIFKGNMKKKAAILEKNSNDHHKLVKNFNIKVVPKKHQKMNWTRQRNEQPSVHHLQMVTAENQEFSAFKPKITWYVKEHDEATKPEKNSNDHHKFVRNFNNKVIPKKDQKMNSTRYRNKQPGIHHPELVSAENQIFIASKPETTWYFKEHDKISNNSRHARSIEKHTSVVDDFFTVDYSFDINHDDGLVPRDDINYFSMQNTMSLNEENNSANQFTSSRYDASDIANISLKIASRTSQTKDQPSLLNDIKVSPDVRQVQSNEDNTIIPPNILAHSKPNELGIVIKDISKSATPASDTLEILKVDRHEKEKLFVFGKSTRLGTVKNSTEVPETLIAGKGDEITHSSSILWWSGYLCVFVILATGFILYFSCKHTKWDCPLIMMPCGMPKVFQIDEKTEKKNGNDFTFESQNEESPDVEEDIQLLKQTIDHIISKYQMHYHKVVEKTYSSPEHHEMMQRVIPIEKDG